MERNTHQTIKNWAEDERPREKLLLKGIKALSDAELIAILIGSGSRNESAVELSRRILQSVHNDWNLLYRLSIPELCTFKGIGEAKAISIVTALEISKRRHEQEVKSLPKITSSQELFRYIHSDIGDLCHEEFWVIFLNNSNSIIGKQVIAKGGISQTTVDIRLILKKALDFFSTAIIIAHNHPSGTLQPSAEDKAITQKVKAAAELMHIQLLDHIIVTSTNYYSFADEGIL